MKLNDSLYILTLARETDGAFSKHALPTINLSLILDEHQGPTLVDTGFPGMIGDLEAALEEPDLKLRDLRRVILTHQDLDHIGNAAEIVRRSGAKVLAHAADTLYIEGKLKSIRTPQPAVLEKMPAEIRAVLERGAEPVHVDQQLEDAEMLDLAGGVRVVFTPGHTPGHLSLYLEKDRILIAADAVRAHAGQLLPLAESPHLDMLEAARSLDKLAGLDIETLVAYHGGVVRGDIQAQLTKLSQASSS
ncbi:MAG: MBL fold metallo-hydrolase [Thermaceae bacterium]|nr:MBL fold metallo-hydrolase [Thermaceae bacterium]